LIITTTKSYRARTSNKQKMDYTNSIKTDIKDIIALSKKHQGKFNTQCLWGTLMNTPYPELIKEKMAKGMTYPEVIAKFNECCEDANNFEVHMLTERNEKGELIGYMVYDYPKDTYEKGDKKGGQIEYMYVCEGHRNKGIGTRMITEAITQMEKLGRTRLKCDAHWEDMRFLSKFGFEWDAPPTGGMRAMYRMTMPYATMFKGL